MTALQELERITKAWREDRDTPGYNELMALKRVMERESRPPVPGFSELAAMSAYDSSFSFKGGPVPCTPATWQKAWRAALDWAAAQAPLPEVYQGAQGNLHVKGSDNLLAWVDNLGATHVVTHTQAVRELREFYDEWPGGMEEISSCISRLRADNARLGDFERHLESISLFNDDGKLHLAVGHPVDDATRDVYYLGVAGGSMFVELVDWMQRKNELLTGTRRYEVTFVDELGTAHESPPAPMTVTRPYQLAGLIGHIERHMPDVGLTIAGDYKAWSTVTNPDDNRLMCMPRELLLYLLREEAGVPHPVPVKADEYRKVLVDYVIRTGRIQSDVDRAIDGLYHEEPRPTAWLEWCGAALRDANCRSVHWPTCPVRTDARIRIRHRDGEEREVDQPGQLRWAWSRPYLAKADIVAYQVIDDGEPF